MALLMPLVLLNISREQFTNTRNAAKQGDKEAARALNELWSDYDAVDLECFLCGATTPKRPYMMVLPERDRHDKVMAVPLCQGCGALPEMTRLNRALKILKAMWSKPGGPQIHFLMMPQQQRY
jgi:hypothetical protein